MVNPGKLPDAGMKDSYSMETRLRCESLLNHNIEVLNAAVTPPFQLDDDNLSENVRLTHRVIDLRRPQMQKNMMLRYKTARAFRRFLDDACHEKKNKAFNPVHVSCFGTNGIMFHPQLIANLIKQSGRFTRGVFLGRIRGCHNFTAIKNKALRVGCQIIHLEGAFHGIF